VAQRKVAEGGEDPGVQRHSYASARLDPELTLEARREPTTGGESVDSPKLGGELPDVKTRSGRRSLS
ncbi:MAG: hypothetical protein ACK53T_02590, partial [Planctomycetota bacterium]